MVENLTGGDWKDVELTLVSGDPVALRQPLYTALFADRPEVPVSTGTRIVPRKDDVQEKPDSAPRQEAGRFAAAPAQRLTRNVQVEAAAPRSAPAAAPPPPAQAANAAAAEEASTQLLYRFPAKVSLATGHTMMLPFVDREIPVDAHLAVSAGRAAEPAARGGASHQRGR